MSEVVQEEIRRTARPAILLRRSGLPVPLSHPARSFFGGLPRLPPYLTWPEQLKFDETCAFMFIAQIDLADLPAVERSPLPRSGTLYFFYDANNDSPDEDDVRVLYAPCGGDDFPEQEPPASLGPYGIGGEPWMWLRPDEFEARVDFKYPIAFVPFNSYCDHVRGEVDNPYARRPHAAEYEQLLIAELDARFGAKNMEPVVYLRDAIERGSGDWPFVWGVIEHSARAICHAIDGCQYSLRNKPEHIVAEFARIRERAAEWAQRAASQPAVSACDEPTKTLYRQAWSSIGAAIKEVSSTSGVYGIQMEVSLREAIWLACSLCSSHSALAAARIPESYRCAIEGEVQWRKPQAGGDEIPIPLHQMLGYGESVQAAPLTYGHDVLLLQLKGDPGLAWHSNVGCALQFWIAPRALSELSFDAVKVTLECD